MLKFVAKIFGCDNGRIEYLESKCLEQSELIRTLAEGFKEQALLLQKVSEEKLDMANVAKQIDYNQIFVDYEELASKVEFNVTKNHLAINRIAEQIDLGEVANNINLDDLSSYFNVDEVAANLDLNEDDFVDAVAEKVNNSFQPFMVEAFRCQPGFDGIIKAGREIVSDRGIFVDKKRYILHVVDKEGKSKDELKTMGLELKKTTLPKYVQDKLSSFIERLLKGEEWNVIAPDVVEFKDELKRTVTRDQVLEIGLPKGANKVEIYTQKYEGTYVPSTPEERAKNEKLGPKTRLPGHISACIFYNMCLDSYKDNDSMRIVTGTKIKVYYLTQSFGRFKSIALPTDIERIPEWFIQDFLPLIDIYAQIERLVDDPLENTVYAVGYAVPEKQDLMVEDLVGVGYNTQQKAKKGNDSVKVKVSV